MNLSLVAYRRSTLVGLLLAVAAVLLWGGPAAAHAELESSSPKDGATRTSAPAEISFTFGEELLETGYAVTLAPTGSDDRLPLDEPTVSGDTISVPWPATAPAGEFTAAYRVVSADGHPIEGAITFTVTTATGASPATDPTVTTEPSAVAVSPAPSTMASPAPPGGSASGSASGSGVLTWVLSIGVVALVVVLAGIWMTRRARR